MHLFPPSPPLMHLWHAQPAEKCCWANVGVGSTDPSIPLYSGSVTLVQWGFGGTRTQVPSSLLFHHGPEQQQSLMEGAG